MAASSVAPSPEEAICGVCSTEEQHGLLAGFPNLRGLEPVGPPERWPESPVPRLDPDCHSGVLQNGLTYFVQENKEPKQRASLYLVVGFGSLVEEEEERGIAHIIEHLGFSATKAYENHAIVKFLESIGAPFGACQNAYTSFDRTVYTLHVPTDKEGILEESLTVLREFAFFTRISEEDLDKERKVVLEEWRESKNAQGRLFEEYINALCKGCKWCERLPIGKEDVIRGVSASTLRDFYRRFYHPAKMSVIAVGDFKVSPVIEQVKSLFDIPPATISPLPRSEAVPDRPVVDVPPSVGVTVASSTDPELTFAQGIIDCKRPRRREKFVADVRRSLVEDLFHKALSSRLFKLTVEPKGTRNFFMVSTETGEPVPSLNPMTINIAPLPGRMRPALEEIMTEIERVKQLGFHESEVQRAKRSFLADFEMDYVERSQRSSDSIADEYVSLFLDNNPSPGVAMQSRIAVTVIPSISAVEISRVADEYNFATNVVVKLATPPLSLRSPLYSAWNLFQAIRHLRIPRTKLDLPCGADIEDIVRTVQAKTLEPWPADEDDPSARLGNLFNEVVAKAALDAPGVVDGPNAPFRSMRTVDAPGVPEPVRGATLDVEKPVDGVTPAIGEEVVLRNGLRLFFKSTDLFDDEIVMRGRRWGGLTEHQSDGILGHGRGVVKAEAQVCSMVATMLGIGGLSVESMQESLEGKRVEPNPPTLECYHTAIDATASPMDFETLLLLIHLMFANPVEPQAASRARLSLVKLGLLAWRLGEDRDPSSRFSRRVLECITGNHPYTRKINLWSILCLNFKKASAIFNERASRPCEWTFTFVGKLPDREALLPILDKYLGAIPNYDRSVPGVLSVLPQAERRSDYELREAVTPLDVRFPEGTLREKVHLKMIDPKGSTVIYFPIQLGTCTELGSLQSAETELRDIFRMRVLVRMLETRLVEVLRFRRGQVYGVSVGEDFGLASPRMGCKRKGTLSINFECDPAEADELIEVTLDELNQLRSGKAAFTQENVDAARVQDRRQLEENFLKNDWWAGTILDLYFSRTNVITEDVGRTVSLWWRVRSEALSSWTVDCASKLLAALLPMDASSAVITMRPKKRLWGVTKTAPRVEDAAASKER